MATQFMPTDLWIEVYDKAYAYSEIANLLGVSYQTVRTWTKRRRLPSGHRRGQARFIEGRRLAEWLVVTHRVPVVYVIDAEGYRTIRWDLDPASDQPRKSVFDSLSGEFCTTTSE